MNVFHGRIDGDRASSAASTVPLPAEPRPVDGHAAVFIRPHLLDIHAEEPAGGQLARAGRCTSTRPARSSRSSCVTDGGDAVRVELSQDR